MRLFFAIGIPPEIRKRLFEAERRLLEYGGMKGVEEKNLHITLKFLGEVEEKKVKEMEEKAELVARESKGFEVKIQNLGVFPSREKMRVVWAGCEDNGKIRELHERLSDALGRKEERFHPHITLCRIKYVKDKGGIRELLDKREAFGEFHVDSFDLMESILRGGGPVYRVVKKFVLQ